jgi:hypothetical protein
MDCYSIRLSANPISVSALRPTASAGLGLTIVDKHLRPGACDSWEIPAQTKESTEFIEQRLCLLQIKRFEALAKPIIHARKQFTGFGALASIAPKPRQACRCPQLPGFCSLFSRNCERPLEMRFCFADVLFGSKQCDFPGDATNIGFAPPFSSLFNRRQSFGHVLPCLVELAKFRH